MSGSARGSLRLFPSHLLDPLYHPAVAVVCLGESPQSADHRLQEHEHSPASRRLSANPKLGKAQLKFPRTEAALLICGLQRRSDSAGSCQPSAPQGSQLGASTKSRQHRFGGSASSQRAADPLERSSYRRNLAVWIQYMHLKSGYMVTGVVLAHRYSRWT